MIAVFHIKFISSILKICDLQKAFKNRLKQWIYTCRSLWIAGRRDSTLFGVVDDTTTTKFTGRACAVQCNSLPVVVDQAVVVVLKFPIVSKGVTSQVCLLQRDPTVICYNRTSPYRHFCTLENSLVPKDRNLQTFFSTIFTTTL